MAQQIRTIAAVTYQNRHMIFATGVVIVTLCVMFLLPGHGPH